MIRRYWRELTVVLCLVAPLLALLGLGLVRLVEHGDLLLWGVPAIALLAAALLLSRWARRDIRDEARILARAAAPDGPDWGAREREAMALVEEIGRETPPLTFTESEPARLLIERIVDRVATHYHPGVSHVRYHATLPEMLLLTERLARDLRIALIRFVPGVRQVPVSLGFGAFGTYERHRGWIRAAIPVVRNLLRVQQLASLNLVGLIQRELNQAGWSQVLGHVGGRAREELTAILVRETGRAAIDLYSGRLRLTEEELAVAGARESRQAVSGGLPAIRILLAGQVNAGKSSLLNALAGALRRGVDITESRDRKGEIELSLAGRPELILIDSEGIGTRAAAIGELLETAGSADLVIWVASAVQPAREPDRVGLERMRAAFAETTELRAPRVIGVLTHVDRLRPAAEWRPPYDIDRADRPKAAAIREAVKEVADVLGLPAEEMVPVSVREPADAYNVDLVWGLIAANLDEAKLVKLIRLRRNARTRPIREAVGAAMNSGRFLGKSILEDLWRRLGDRMPEDR